MIFAALDKQKYSIRFLEESWEAAEKLCERNGFTQLGRWICDYARDGSPDILTEV